MRPGGSSRAMSTQAEIDRLVEALGDEAPSCLAPRNGGRDGKSGHDGASEAGKGKWESVSRSDKSVFMLERGAVAGYVVRHNALQASGRSPKK